MFDEKYLEVAELQMWSFSSLVMKRDKIRSEVKSLINKTTSASSPPCLLFLRVLEPEPPQPAFVHQHPEATPGHRAVVHVPHASGVISLLTGRLEAGDPADV